MKRKAIKKAKVTRRAGVIIKTKVICAYCREDWQCPGNPARCPACGESSYAIAVEI